MNHGNIEFFTVTCLNWQTLLKEDKHKQIILDSLAFLTKDQRIWLYAYVIMPNHMHILWRKQNDWIEKNVQQNFLKYTAQQIKFSLLKDNPNELAKYTSTQSDRQFQFWERRPYRTRIFTRAVAEQKINYMHFNPVKAGLCKLPEDYLFSSAQYYCLNQHNPLITHYMEHI
jgi:REP element-mobilizing transposase RayT